MHFFRSTTLWISVVSVTALVFLLLVASGLPAVTGVQETRAKLESNTSSLPSSSSPILENPLATDAQPLGITMGPNGNVWFAENNVTTIVEYIPTNDSFTTFPVPMNGTSMIWFMFFDPSGNLWFSNQLQQYLWRFSPATGQFANFTTGNEYVRPFGLAYDNRTNQIWFTSTYTDQIGYFNLKGESATMGGLINVTGTPILQIPPLYGPTGIQIGLNGNIFISEPFSANIVEYSPSQNAFNNDRKLPSASQPVGIALDNTLGRVWFANHASSLFGYLDEATGKVVQFATSPYEFFGDTITLPYWIRITPNGTIWFDEHASNKIARYDPVTGTLTEFAVPTKHSAPLHFVIDNQRKLIWFTEFFGSNLARVSENSTCQCTVKLSTRDLTLSSDSVSFYLKYQSEPNQGLIASSPAPLITGTFQINGYLTNNLTTSSSVVNSSSYKITLTRGQDLKAGNYSITVCPRLTSSDNITSPAPVRECATSLLTVVAINPSDNTLFLIGIIVVAAVVTSVGLSLFYMRRKSERPQTS